MKVIVYIFSIFLIGNVCTKTINQEFFQQNMNKRLENTVLNTAKLPTLDMKNNETTLIEHHMQIYAVLCNEK